MFWVEADQPFIGLAGTASVLHLELQVSKPIEYFALFRSDGKCLFKRLTRFNQAALPGLQCRERQCPAGGACLATATQLE